ncbi:unnamed protein product [Acanthoscelides obtectus]|uniref:Uncharacterized protein n=1 Tax=Acanthoscelides obtectus TaxID=200917 RepID=A0A9P0P144_ACAOB|nr:unnamed protein product [Acanthoscelides obtectus]CAK1667315.1 hypothetical protein AOBTE_LOCUS25772 [Acanthoscelides obtectus]
MRIVAYMTFAVHGEMNRCESTEGKRYAGKKLPASWPSSERKKRYRIAAGGEEDDFQHHVDVVPFGNQETTRLFTCVHFGTSPNVISCQTQIVQTESPRRPDLRYYVKPESFSVHEPNTSSNGQRLRNLDSAYFGRKQGSTDKRPGNEGGTIILGAEYSAFFELKPR